MNKPEALAADVGKSTESSAILQLVTFTLGNEEYAVDILKVQEINRMKEITRIPNLASHTEGVINLRGKVIPVVNLRKKFGLEDQKNNAQFKIMITDVQNSTMGLVVDSVSEVLRIPSNIVEPPPPLTSNLNTEFIKGIAKLEDRLIILLDMDKLLGTEEKTTMINN